RRSCGRSRPCRHPRTARPRARTPADAVRAGRGPTSSQVTARRRPFPAGGDPRRVRRPARRHRLGQRPTTRGAPRVQSVGRDMARKDKISADQLRETAQDAAHEAGKIAKSLADQGKDWATPRVEAAIEWAGPRVETAWKKGVEVAAPRVADAASKSRDAVDVAHEKIVEDVIPRVIAAMEEAARAAKGGADDLHVKATAALTAAEKAVQKQEAAAKGGNKFAKTLGWVLVGSAVAGAGVLIWRRTQPVDDPWAEEYWDDAVVTTGTTTDTSSVADQAKHVAT